MVKHVTLIGAGQVATQLGVNLKQSGFIIDQVYSRNINNALTLANKINASAIDAIESINTNADLYIISVSDNAVKLVSDALPTVKGLVVHTAGSLSLKTLEKHANHGIFYPFQTFSKDRNVGFEKIPLLLEANSTENLVAITAVANQLSTMVMNCDSEQRKQVHIAAVFACNFTNHMYSIAQDILENNKLSFDIIKPLIAETAEKILHLNPKDAQTGPAVRNDQNVVDSHINMLESNPTQQALYKLISNEITTKMGKE